MTDRQEVNLYLEHLRPQVDWLSLKWLGRYVVGWLSLLLALVALDTYQNSVLQAAIASQARQLQQLTAQVQRIKGQLPQSRAVELDREMAQLGKEVERRRAISRLISGQDLGNTTGFSQYLQSLARHSSSELALQRFHFSQGGLLVALAGEVREAQVLPAYLDALQGEASFKGSRFGQLDISREQRRLTFSMNRDLQGQGLQGQGLQGPRRKAP